MVSDKKRIWVSAIWGQFIFILFIGVSFGASSKITYQGQLREQGVPVTANKSMEFKIFTSSTGGSAVWSSGAQTVSVINGLFRTLLEPTGVDWESEVFIEVSVEGTSLSPREELNAAPFSINSKFLSGKAYTNAGTAPSSPSVGDFWFNTGTNALNVWSGSSWDTISSGGSGGGTVTVENGDTVIEASASRIDFNGTFFSVTSGPSGEANVTITGNSITDSQISNSAGIQLSKLEKDPSQTGTINTSTNPVDWTLLKNVPAGFSDGVDNLGAGTPVVEENDVVVDAAVGTFDFLGSQFDVTSNPSGEANIALSPSSVTLQGNAFNGANQLMQLDGSANLPALNGSALTNLTASNLVGTVANSAIDTSSITKQGNSFNAASRLVLLDGSGNLPALNGSALTNLDASDITGTVPNSTLDSSSVTKQGNTFNGANQLVLLNGSGVFPALSAVNLTNIPASNLSGTIPNASIDGSSLTKQGNSFNGTSQLVRLDSSGNLAISGWSTIDAHLTATKSIDFGTPTFGTCESDTIGVPGARDGDTLYLGIPNALATADANHVIYAFVSSDDVVTVRRCNPCALATCPSLTDPAAATIRVDVWRH